jgi:hypothetical protein
MLRSDSLRSLFVGLPLAVALFMAHTAGQEAPRETQGLPARAAPTDYQAHVQAGRVILAADFTGHAIPNAQDPLTSEDYVAVEVALFGPDGERLTINATEFSLRLNGKKPPLPSQPWGLVARNIKDPEWLPPEAAEPKSKGGISGGGGGGGGRQPGEPPPPPPKVPIELLRNWQQRLARAALAEGDRPLPQAGLLFFQYRGKTENIRSAELIYEGAAGKATLPLR